MCLDLRVVLPEGSSGSLGVKRLSALSGLHVTAVKTEAGRCAFHFASDPGCSCGLLTPGFEIGAPAWPLTHRASSGLVTAIQAIGAVYPSFLLSSAWLGAEEAPARSTVSLAQLAEELRSGTLKANRVRLVS